MSTFDGLQAIIGHTGAPADSTTATDAGGERPTETGPPLAAPAPAVSPSAPLEAASSHTAEPQGHLDDPGLLDLDRGVYNGRNNADGADGAPTDDLALLWLDDGVYDEDGAVAGTPHTSIDTDGLDDLYSDQRSPAATAVMRRQLLPEREERLHAEPEVGSSALPAGHVNQLFAAIMLILAMLLGASGAVVVFHDRVSQVFAQWL